MISCGSDLSYKEQISQYNKFVLAADSLNKIKNYKQAILISTQAIEITDTLSKALIARGEGNLGLNNFDDSEDDFSDAIKIEGEKSLAYRGKAIANLLNNDKSDFLEDINIYLTHHQKDVYAFSLRADYYAEDEEYDKAIIDYSFCLKNKPENSSFYLKRGNVYAINGQDALSVKDYQNYTRLNPDKNNDQIFYKRAVLNMKSQNFQKAIDDFTLISKLFVKAEVFDLKADCFYNLKNYNKAIENYTFYLTKKPNNYEVIYKRGDSYLKIDNLNKANNDFKKSATLKWESKGFFYKYGWYILFILGYFLIGLISSTTIKEEYDNKKISTAYFYYFIVGIFGGQYLYTISRLRYILHTGLIFTLLFLNCFYIRSFYNNFDLLSTNILNSGYSLYIIYFIILLLIIDIVFLPYFVFSHNHNLRLSINDIVSKKRKNEIDELESLMKKQNTKFKTLKS
jgi:tetratricopeptide (TPR) repeat protein